MADNNSTGLEHANKSTFGERLIEALEFHGKHNGMHERNQQIEALAVACKATPKTISNYLSCNKTPNFKSASRLHHIAIALNADWVWLYDGSGYPPWAVFVIKSMQKMTEWEKNKYLRMVIRMRNGDKKVEQLRHARDCGLISTRQFFSMM